MHIFMYPNHPYSYFRSQNTDTVNSLKAFSPWVCCSIYLPVQDVACCHIHPTACLGFWWKWWCCLCYHQATALCVQPLPCRRKPREESKDGKHIKCSTKLNILYHWGTGDWWVNIYYKILNKYAGLNESFID